MLNIISGFLIGKCLSHLLLSYYKGHDDSSEHADCREHTEGAHLLTIPHHGGSTFPHPPSVILISKGIF